MKYWKQAFIGLLVIIALAITACDDGSNNDNGIDPGTTGGAYTPGTYLITTTWRQRAPYNSKTPIIDGQQTPVGCGPVATAQIMNYHKWPPRSIDTIPAYTSSRAGYLTNMSAVPPIGIDWDNMADTYNATSTEAQKDAVATLLSVVGTAVRASYSPDATGSNINVISKSLVSYFGYDYSVSERLYKNNYSASEWERILKEQIDQGLPVLYAGKNRDADNIDEDDPGNGHIYVIDGYDADGKFHVNWGGGGGVPDGFYDLNGDKFNYRYDQRAVINIKPGTSPGNKLLKTAKIGGTHILENNIDGTDRLSITLDVKNNFTLDLNGYKLTIDISNTTFGRDGIKIAPNKTFTIKDSKSGGTLNVIGANNGAGINATDGTLVIESGTVNVTGGSYAAGIGGGRDGNGGVININGGMVVAIGGSAEGYSNSGSGIGGGDTGSGGVITISGGTVEATGGRYAAGIGGGRNGNGGVITINGGTVVAIGGSAEGYSNSGSGIGGGDTGSGGVITISGGMVEATGGKSGAGIGGGRVSNGGTITITDGTVIATASDGAGIGGGRDGSSGNITITGGTITAENTKNGSGIGGGWGGSGDNITITGGVVTATASATVNNPGAGIGGGYQGNGGVITIDGGTIVATGGTNGSAGIGGGRAGNGGTITITGGTITATGGTGADNIGKGRNGTSSGEIVIGEGAVIK